MKYLKIVVLAVASTWLSATGPAFGAAGFLEPAVTVTPLQNNVTYSVASPVLDTYAGFTVTGFANTGTNTINDVNVTFSATVTDQGTVTKPGEVFSLYLPDQYLSGLPSGCSWPTGQANPVTITCRIKQLKAGESFPGFTAFYKVPRKVINGVADGGPSPDVPDYISTNYTIVYAEGLNDCPNCTNSIIPKSFPNQVLLGTTSPIDVRSGVPKNGAKLFTGTGVPKNEPDKKFTEEAQIPPLPMPIPYAKSSLLISYVDATDTTTTNGVNCGQLGNFALCPTYETKITDPNSGDTPITFTVANPLKLIFRVDASNVKRQQSQLFNNVLIQYIPDGSSAAVNVPKTCMNNQATGDGIPCVLSFQCFKPNDKTPDLPGDCEFVTIGTKNGRTILQ